MSYRKLAGDYTLELTCDKSSFNCFILSVEFLLGSTTDEPPIDNLWAEYEDEVIQIARLLDAAGLSLGGSLDCAPIAYTHTGSPKQVGVFKAPLLEAILTMYGWKNRNQEERDKVIQYRLDKITIGYLTGLKDLINPKGFTDFDGNLEVKTKLYFLAWLVHHSYYSGDAETVIAEAVRAYEAYTGTELYLTAKLKVVQKLTDWYAALYKLGLIRDSADEGDDEDPCDFILVEKSASN